MRYRMFLYKTTHRSVGSWFVRRLHSAMIHSAMVEGSDSEWKSNGAYKSLEDCDADKVAQDVRTALTENGIPLCRTAAEHRLEGKGQYVSIVTSYENASRVLRMAHSFAMERGLVLYDAEMDRAFFPDDLSDGRWISMRLRVKEINQKIRETQQPIWKLRQIDLSNGEREKCCAYVLTLKKHSQISFEQRIQSFYKLMKNELAAGETLSTESQCFTVCGDGYSIMYCLEAYKKRADWIGFVENGVAKTAVMHRMSTEVAIKKQQEQAGNRIADRMQCFDWIRKYPNPADRFSASTRLELDLKKQPFDVSIRRIGCYGSEILFHVVTDEYFGDGKDFVSVFYVEEESASYILPAVQAVYPYFLERYYLTPNHIPSEMMEEIVEMIKEARELVVNHTYDAALAPWIQSFNLYILASYDGAGGCSCEEWQKIEQAPVDFVYEHRYEIAHFYDLFIDWAEAQLRCYSYTDIMFNIQGP